MAGGAATLGVVGGWTSQGDLREWLRVPEQLALPGWAAERLRGSVTDALRARDGRPLHSVVFGIVDLETTGVAADRHRILEIGLVVQRAGRTLDRYSTLVDSGDAIPPAIQQLTGIRVRDLDGAPNETEALAGLRAALDRNRVSVLVAHNAPFDRRFLERAWREQHADAPEAVLPPFVCSLRLARRLVRAPRHGLDVLARHLGIPVAERHRALADAEITATLWWELLGRARLEEIHTLESLREAAEPRRSRPKRRPRRVVDVPGAMG